MISDEGAAMIKVSLIILSGLCVARLMTTRSSALRHWVLSAAIACAAAVPVIELVVPAWGNSIGGSPKSASNVLPATSVTRPQQQTSWTFTEPRQPSSGSFSMASLRRSARVVWLTGAATGLFFVLVGLGRLRWLALRSCRLQSGRWAEHARQIAGRYGIRRPIAILQSSHPSLLVTWGLWHPKVILPAGAHDWPEARIRIVLGHELAHVQRGDWVAQLGAELLRCVYWFNPLVWMASRRLRQESEQACDDVVLSLGVEGPEYAGHLLDLARAARRHRVQWLNEATAPGMARPGSLERRVTAMLNSHINRVPLTRTGRLATLVGLLAVTVIVGGFRADAQAFAGLSGAVLDPQSRGIPAVTVSLTNIGNQAKHEVRTDDLGQFEFVGVPAGQYQLEAAVPGFQTFRTTMALQPRRARQDIAMKVGSLTETVTIQGSSTAGTRADSPKPRSVDPLAVDRTIAACTASGAGGQLRPPTKIGNVNPVYPDPDGKLEGVVVLEGRVATDGSVTQAKVLRSPHVELERAALDAFEQWQFTPTLLNCVPIEVTITATMNFSVKP